MANIGTIDLKKLGENIRFLRNGKGWTLADLAKESKISKAYISDLENGSAGKPNIQYVFSIACALDEQAETGEKLGPLSPNWIEILPAARSMSIMGTRKGLTRRAPLCGVNQTRKAHSDPFDRSVTAT